MYIDWTGPSFVKFIDTEIKYSNMILINALKCNKITLEKITFHENTPVESENQLILSSNKVSLELVFLECEFSNNSIDLNYIAIYGEADMTHPEIFDDLDMVEDPVPTLTRRHFEFGLNNCRISVAESDLTKYEDFKNKFDPSFSSSKSNRGGFNWPDDNNSNIVQPDKDDDLDLYS